MRQLFGTFATQISLSARQANATWPIFRIPDFELLAGQIRAQSGVEVIGCAYRIEPSNEEEYLKFVDANYEDSVIERYMTLYGNLDRLKTIGYSPNFTILGPKGLTPDIIDRPIRWVDWQSSPRTFSSFSCFFMNEKKIMLSYIHHLAFLAINSTVDVLYHQLGYSEFPS
jgi:hypothetical protein